VIDGTALVLMLRLPLVAVEYERVNLAVPIPLAVPLIAPVELFRLAQEGREPLATDQVEDTQPLSVAVCE